jgi:outer membrane protein TolC
LRTIISTSRLFLPVAFIAVVNAQKPPAAPGAPAADIASYNTSGRRSAPNVHPHEFEMSRDHVYTLGELIDIAESNNPSTRVAWSAAKQRAAAVGIATSEMLPTIIGMAITRTFQEPLLLYRHFQLQDIGLIKTMLRMNYTLIDFGTRRSEIDAAKARLLQADFNFNDVHLQIIYDVVKKYYDLQNAIGLRDAAEANLRDYRALAQAAQERLDNGLATLPDVLEARAASAKAEYELHAADRNEQVVFGNLATTLTATPRVAFKVQGLDELTIPDALPESEEAAEERAMNDRPDLQGRLAAVQMASAEVRHARSAYYPKLEFEGDAGWLRAWGQQEKLPGIYGHVKVYDARVTLSWTIFDGLRREKELARAKAERDTAEAEVNEARDHIADQVWTAYRDAETALEQRKAARALLQAATESYSAATEAYGYGVRNILDVLEAERALANARAADVTARAEVLNTMNELAYRTGSLLFDHPSGGRP